MVIKVLCLIGFNANLGNNFSIRNRIFAEKIEEYLRRISLEWNHTMRAPTYIEVLLVEICLVRIVWSEWKRKTKKIAELYPKRKQNNKRMK